MKEKVKEANREEKREQKTATNISINTEVIAKYYQNSYLTFKNNGKLEELLQFEMQELSERKQETKVP